MRAIVLSCGVQQRLLPKLSISRFQEYQILKAIEHDHIGPKAELVNEHGLLVEWIDGESLRDGIAFDVVLKTQTRIHELDIHRIPVAPLTILVELTTTGYRSEMT